MPLPKLRDYQETVLKNTNASFQKHDRVLIVAGTGAGKTVISSCLIHQAVSQKKKILFLVHRNILIDQTLEELANWGVIAGVIAGTYKEDRTCPVQVASCQTLSRRSIDWFDFDLAIFDEAHITSFSESALEFFPKLRDSLAKKLDKNEFRTTAKKRKLIGLTATPFRLGSLWVSGI